MVTHWHRPDDFTTTSCHPTPVGYHVVMTNRTSTPRTAAELIDNDRVLKLADPRLVADIDAILNAFAEAARIDAEAEQARIDAEAQRRADLLADARRNDPEMSARVAARRAARRAERNF